MGRITKVVHIVLTVAAWGILFCSLIRLAVVWDSLPDELGVHFDGNGEFDAFDSKTFICYPYLIALAALGFCETAVFISKKINTGIKMSKKGETKFKTALVMILDISKFLFSFFFAGVWADCVIRQHPLDTNIPNFFVLVLFISFIVFVIAAIVIKIKNPPVKERNEILL